MSARNVNRCATLTLGFDNTTKLPTRAVQMVANPTMGDRAVETRFPSIAR
jgi:hypothetical protein